MNARDKQTVSLWMNVEVAPDAPCLTKDERADVVIVGSGIAGLACADRSSIAASVSGNVWNWPDGFFVPA